MAELKTKQTEKSVTAFLDGVDDPKRRADCDKIVAMMKSITRKEPKMWGPTMVGFGEYHYQYESGREGDLFLVGFSPRKTAFSFYLWWLLAFPELLKKLGKHKTGKGCLYIKQLEDVDKRVLRELIKKSVTTLKKKSLG